VEKEIRRACGIPGEILIVEGEAMIPYLVRLLDITMNNNAIPDD